MKENREDLLLFKEAFNMMAGILHKKTLSRDELRKTWELLKEYSVEEVTKAIDEWLLKDNNFMPAPGELSTIIKNNNCQNTGELKNIKELINIKNNIKIIGEDDYKDNSCTKCRGTGFVVLQQPQAPHYTQAFACDCDKGILKINKMETYAEGLNKGFEYII